VVPVTRESIGAQLRDSMIGWSRDIKPVPKSGRIRFDDIGNLSVIEHAGAKNVGLEDMKFQQMLGNVEIEKPIDILSWRGAIYAMGKPTKINSGVDQSPPDPDAWMMGIIQPFAGSRSTADIDSEDNAIRIVADTPDWNVQATSTACVYYVGRLPVGTKLKVSVELTGRNQERWGQPIVCSFRGWPAGWFGNQTGQGEGVDYNNYIQFSRRTSQGPGEWQSYDTQIEIVEGFEDLWVAVECRSNEAGRDEGKLNIGYFRGIKIELA
jgi:hypothetical protein